MTKTIRVAEDVYRILLSKKRRGESFSETVRRLTAKGGRHSPVSSECLPTSLRRIFSDSVKPRSM